MKHSVTQFLCLCSCPGASARDDVHSLGNWRIRADEEWRTKRGWKILRVKRVNEQRKLRNFWGNHDGLDGVRKAIWAPNIWG